VDDAGNQSGWLRTTAERVAFVIGLALLWEYAVEIFNIKAYLLPPPSRILASLWSNRSVLIQQSIVTIWEIVLGYVSAVLGGIAIGLAIFAVPSLMRILYPLMVIWVGYGISSKVLMAFLFAFFPVVITTLGGLAGTPVSLIEHFRANRASQWTMFRRLQIPSALPSIMDGCKTAMPLAVIGAVVGEFVGAEQGLGYLILEANAAARSDLLFAALVVISVIAGALYWLVELIAARVWWRAF
jgi:NitT/TauT family transport system permease protein